jgi:hypothetical protein
MWAVAHNAQRKEQEPAQASMLASFQDQQAKHQQLPVQRTRKRNHKHHLST